MVSIKPSGITYNSDEIHASIDEAIQKNDIKKLASMFDKQAVLINLQDENMLTPLHKAAKLGKYDICELLIKKKANVNLKDGHQLTPLHIAVMENNYAICELLIENNADVNLKDGDQLTPLHLIANLIIKKKEGALRIATLLLEHGANPDIINSKNQTVWNILQGTPFIKRLRKSQKNYLKSSPKKSVIIESKQETPSEIVAPASKKKRRKRKKKKKNTVQADTKETKKEPAETKKTHLKNLQQTFRNVKRVGHAVIAGEIPTVTNIPNLETSRRTLHLRHQKAKPIKHKTVLEETWKSQYGIDTPYTITIFPFVTQDEFKNKAFKPSLALRYMYESFIETRLQTISNLIRDNMQNVIQKTKTDIPNITLIKHLLTQPEHQKYKANTIANKLDLYHLFDPKVDEYISTHGITEKVTNQEGKQILQVVIPGKMSWNVKSKNRTVYGFFQYSFAYDSNTLGKCYHRFFRPLNQPGPYISQELQQALKKKISSH